MKLQHKTTWGKSSKRTNRLRGRHNKKVERSVDDIDEQHDGEVSDLKDRMGQCLRLLMKNAGDNQYVYLSEIQSQGSRKLW